MTELEKEVQELRAENKKLKKELQKLEQMHWLDMSEIAFQRRAIDLLMEGK